MDDVLRYIKRHKKEIVQFGKKALTWWKKFQNDNNKPTSQSGFQQQQQQHYGGGGGEYGGHYQSAPPPSQSYGGGGGYAGAVTNGYGSPPPQSQSQYQQHQGSQYQDPHYQGQQHQGPHPPFNETTTHQTFSTDDQVNQNDAHYLDLRNRARIEGDAMAKCFDQVHNTYNDGNGANAKQLSSQGRQHKSEMERLNQQAADWIFIANNQNSPPGTIDLHGLYTSEALERTEKAIKQAQGGGANSELRIIVGKGIHSKDHRQHIAPAVEKLMREYRLDAHIDPHNTGVLIVNLHGSGSGNTNFTRDLARQASGDENQCVIM